jgi:hypothetical protein
VTSFPNHIFIQGQLRNTGYRIVGYELPSQSFHTSPLGRVSDREDGDVFLNATGVFRSPDDGPDRGDGKALSEKPLEGESRRAAIP